MPTFRRPALAAEARRRNLEQLVVLGLGVKSARGRRRYTQQQLADRAGLSRSAVSDLENGRGGTHTLDVWQRVALAAGRRSS